MRRDLKSLSLLLLLCILVTGLSSCIEVKNNGTETGEVSKIEEVDYVGQLKLDMKSTSLKQEVTVKTFVDGDTTHFNLKTPINGSSTLKARYLAINTPESTGKIEEWGKRASRFTKEKLSTAVSIIVESDDSNWNADSTGDRYLVWVWYQPSEGAEYRNLNLEILQNGLAVASNSAQNRYGDLCMKALSQAKQLSLYVHSKDKDPDYPYGEAVELTLKELRTNIADYEGMKVAFTGIITRDFGNSIYVESYDEETGVYFGISVYYGYNVNGDLMEQIVVGNETRVVGSVQAYYDSYQVSGIQYRMMKPNDPDNTKMISSGHTAAYPLTEADTFVNGKINVVNSEDEAVEFDYAALVMNTTISMQNLQVVSIYTTTNDESSSKGAMTLTCKVGNVTVVLRTEVLRDANSNLVTADRFEGKTIDVKGIVDYYEGSYQIRIFSVNDIIVK